MARNFQRQRQVIATMIRRTISTPWQLPLLVLAVALIAGLKIFLAAQLELYSDEIFYWQASTRPALAYSDLPFMASLFAGIGALLGGNHPLAVRSLFILCGSLLPLLVYWLARPITDHRQALESALLSLCLPLGAFLGLLAVPDVPLVCLGVMMVGLSERAIRRDTPLLWVAVGCVTALGLSTHYRFILFPAALALFLLLSADHRYLWRTARLWTGGLIGAIGLIPALLFNLQHDLSGLDYHFVDRHPWQFQLDGLMHPVEQLVVVSPLMYVFLLWVLLVMYRRDRKENSQVALLFSFAMAHIGVFMVLAPWADTTRTTLHWPLSGYLPLLVLAPAMLRQLNARLNSRLSAGSARTLVLAIPVTGFFGSLLAFAGIGSQGFNEQLQELVGPGVLSNKMAGWQPMTAHLGSLMNNQGLPADTVIVTDNYYTAAQVAFASGRNTGIYTTDQDKAVRDGRLTQYAIWGMDEAGVRKRQGQSALFISEDSTLNVDEKTGVMARACTLFEQLTHIDQLSLFNDEKVFSFYLGSRIIGADEQHPGTHPCPLPARLWLDSPREGDQLSGQVSVSGWVYNEGEGVDRIYLLIDGQRHTPLPRTVERPDVVEIRQVRHDPSRPTLGFDVVLDTTTIANGQRTVALEVINTHGERQVSPERRIRVQNESP